VIVLGSEKLKISIIVPTFNEAGNMHPLLSRIKNALEEENYEIVIVDDSSPDKTADKALEAARELGIEGRVKVIVRNGERGLSTAVVKGLENADGDIMVVMDGDLQHPPEMIKSLISPIIKEQAEVSIGVRRGKGYQGLSFLRRIVSKAASTLSKILLPQTRNITDPMSGFFALKKEVFRRARGSLNPKGFKILLELIVKANVPPEKIKEVEFVFERRRWGESKLNSREVFNFLWHLLNLNEFRILKFMLVGISGIFVNEGVLWLSYYKAGIMLELSAALGIESSILSNYLLNSIFTFKKRKAGSFIGRMARYHISTAIGVLINYATLLVLSKALHVEVLLSNLIGIFLGFVANYALSERFVWKELSGDET
jgi:dolichol-phosphate mannosyltransferase